MNETPRLKSWLKQDQTPEPDISAEERAETILDAHGWRTINGRARYRGFEDELNPEIPVETMTRGQQ